MRVTATCRQATSTHTGGGCRSASSCSPSSSPSCPGPREWLKPKASTNWKGARFDDPRRSHLDDHRDPTDLGRPRGRDRPPTLPPRRPRWGGADHGAGCISQPLAVPVSARDSCCRSHLTCTVGGVSRFCLGVSAGQRLAYSGFGALRACVNCCYETVFA